MWNLSNDEYAPNSEHIVQQTSDEIIHNRWSEAESNSYMGVGFRFGGDVCVPKQLHA
jgi:hypothetical protein